MFHFILRSIKQELLSYLRRDRYLVTKEDVVDSFTRTIEFLEPISTSHSTHFKALLDTGCYLGDLIAVDVVDALGYKDKIQPCNKVLGVCLNGQELKSRGTITLHWECKGFHKTFKSCFHVIEGDSLPWQVVLGAEICARHNLLTAGAFGGSKRQVFQKNPKKRNAEETARKDNHKREIAKNAEKVAKDTMEKKEPKNPQPTNTNGGSSK